MKKTNGEKKAGIIEKISRSLDIPENVFGSVQIEMRGNIYLRVGGCLGIGEYTEKRIRLETKNGELIISGEKLLCSAYFSGTAVIEGKIYGINFGKWQEESKSDSEGGFDGEEK